MSVIGPRPGLWNQDILTAERDKYNANDVKPGLTPLQDSKVAGFLISKFDHPFLKMNLMKFLSCVHEMILLDKMNTNRANCTMSC